LLRAAYLPVVHALQTRSVVVDGVLPTKVPASHVDHVVQVFWLLAVV
jgi:hypothetical protein